jgi:hypothetical protein
LRSPFRSAEFFKSKNHRSMTPRSIDALGKLARRGLRAAALRSVIGRSTIFSRRSLEIIDGHRQLFVRHCRYRLTVLFK